MWEPLHRISLKRKFVSLVGGFFIHLILGSIYTIGNISIYLASYLQASGSNVTVRDLSIIFPITLFGTTLCFILGSYLTNKYNP